MPGRQPGGGPPGNGGRICRQTGQVWLLLDGSTLRQLPSSVHCPQKTQPSQTKVMSSQHPGMHADGCSQSHPWWWHAWRRHPWPWGHALRREARPGHEGGRAACKQVVEYSLSTIFESAKVGKAHAGAQGILHNRAQQHALQSLSLRVCGQSP